MNGNCEKCKYYIAEDNYCNQDWKSYDTQCLRKDLERVRRGIYNEWDIRSIIPVLKKRISQGEEEFIAALTTLKLIYPMAFGKPCR